jgi:hypothetical protein
VPLPSPAPARSSPSRASHPASTRCAATSAGGTFSSGRRRPLDLAVRVVLHRTGRRAGRVRGRRRVTCRRVRRGRLVAASRGCGVRGPRRVPSRMTGRGMVGCRRGRVATALRPGVGRAAAPALRAGEGQERKQDCKDRQNLHGGVRTADCRPNDGHGARGWTANPWSPRPRRRLQLDLPSRPSAPGTTRKSSWWWSGLGPGPGTWTRAPTSRPRPRDAPLPVDPQLTDDDDLQCCRRRPSRASKL